jgi:hypothetical protein
MHLTTDYLMHEHVHSTGTCFVRLPACFARGCKCRMIAFDRHTQADLRRQKARSPRSHHEQGPAQSSHQLQARGQTRARSVA